MMRKRVAVHTVVMLMVLMSTRSASADWPACGRAIVTAPAGQVHSVITTDGAGGAIIAWQDQRSPRVNIFARHVLASGELDPAWPVDGRALLGDSVSAATGAGGQTTPVIVADGAGGAIVAWQDLRNTTTDVDLFAQHVLATGELDPAWKANGVALCVIEGNQDNHVIVSDGAGGAFVAWEDGRPGVTVKDIFAQHVLAAGTVDPAWPENGFAVTTAAGLQEFPSIVDDGEGNAIVAWDDGRSATTGFDIFARHILASGLADPDW